MRCTFDAALCRSFEKESVMDPQFQTVLPATAPVIPSAGLLVDSAMITDNHLLVRIKSEAFRHDGVIWMLMNEHGLGEVEAKTLFIIKK